MPHRASFWMKNCPLPLTAAYIDPEGVILELHDFQPHNTNSVVASSDRVQFVLEANQGWFGRHNVTTGMVVRTERGPLSGDVPPKDAERRRAGTAPGELLRFAQGVELGLGLIDQAPQLAELVPEA